MSPPNCPPAAGFGFSKPGGRELPVLANCFQLPPLPLLLFYVKGPPAFPTVFNACADSFCTSFTEVVILYNPQLSVAVLDPLHHHRIADKVRQNGEKLETLPVAISP